MTGGERCIPRPIILQEPPYSLLPAPSMSIHWVGMSLKIVDLDRFPGQVRTKESRTDKIREWKEHIVSPDLQTSAEACQGHL